MFRSSSLPLPQVIWVFIVANRNNTASSLVAEWFKSQEVEKFGSFSENYKMQEESLKVYLKFFLNAIIYSFVLPQKSSKLK